MRLADENVGGFPVEVVATRKETIYLEMGSTVRLMEKILEDKAIQCVKKAMNEYCETLVAPWSVYDGLMTVSVKEVVDELQGPSNFPLKVLLGDAGLTGWVLDGYPDEGYTAKSWAGVLDTTIRTVSFEDAMVMWQEALS